MTAPLINYSPITILQQASSSLTSSRSIREIVCSGCSCPLGRLSAIRKIEFVLSWALDLPTALTIHRRGKTGGRMEFNPYASSFSCFNNGSASGSGSHRQSSGQSSSSGGETDGAVGGFDVIAWYPKHQCCQRYFVEVAQHSYPCQALAAFINIKLPFQRAVGSSNPPTRSTPVQPPPPFQTRFGLQLPPPPLAQAQLHHPTMPSHGWVSLYPYIRRLVATGFDTPAILHGWFGDDWECGIGPQHEQEKIGRAHV